MTNLISFKSLVKLAHTLRALLDKKPFITIILWEVVINNAKTFIMISKSDPLQSPLNMSE